MPSVTVHEILRLALPPTTQVVGGADNLSREVTWASMVRATHPALADIEGGELALVSTDSLRFLGGNLSVTRLIEALDEVGASAAGVVGSVTAQDQAVADARGFPLLLLPPDADLRVIMRAVICLIVDRQAQLERLGAQVSQQLTGIAAENRGLQAILEAIAERIGKRVVLQDSDGQPKWQAGPPVPTSLLDRLDTSPQSWPNAGPRLPIILPFEDAPWARLTAPVVVEDRVDGYLSVLAPEGDLDELDRLTVERGAIACALELAKRRAVEVAEDRLRGEFLEGLLRGRMADAAQARRRAAQLGYHIDPPQVIVTCGWADDGASSDLLHLRRFMDYHLRRSGCQAGLMETVEGALVIFCPCRPGDSLAALKQALASALDRWDGDHCNLIVAMGQPYTVLEDLPRAYRESEQSLVMARRLGLRGPTYYDDLGIYRLLLSIPNHDDLRSFYDRTLGPLAEYDADHDAQLVKTLEVLFAHHGNLSQTARALHIHRNTLLYRLDRIAEITGLDLDDPDMRLSLQLALKVQHVLQAQD